MTTNADATQRVLQCTEQGKILIQKGCTEIEIRNELNNYYKIRWVKSYTTRHDDLEMVFTRLFNSQ